MSIATGLGVGATCAMFSITDGILLHPLPFPKSDRLVNVWETATSRNIPKMVAAPGNYYDWRTQAQSFAAIGAFEARRSISTAAIASPSDSSARSQTPASSARSASRRCWGESTPRRKTSPDRTAL
ncbi:MAG: hypothetical protein JWP63_3297 [Candidatus Solibacter sp.]|jgi:putative ABC transport system permease protein|nr:hypothetical protein [Candidatus Solibacter sp.]